MRKSGSDSRLFSSVFMAFFISNFFLAGMSGVNYTCEVLSLSLMVYIYIYCSLYY